jgi:hypothetical protein
MYGNLILIRNLIFAPISEEIVFRSFMIPALCAVYYFKSSESNTGENSDINRIRLSNSNISDGWCVGDKGNFQFHFHTNSSKNSPNLSGISSFALGTDFPLISFIFRLISDDNFLPQSYVQSPWRVVLTCPLWFVVAHVHHCIEKIKNGYTVFQALLGEFHGS